MQRRNALKALALAVGGIMFLPACDRWTKETVQLAQPFLSSAQEEVLAGLAETLIPTTDTPGAKVLEVPAFVQRMLKDCYEPELQETVLKGLDRLEAEAEYRFGASFAAAATAQKEELMAAMEGGAFPQSAQPEQEAGPDEAAELQQVYALLKGLIVRGYLTSEWVMRNHSNYQQNPGHYRGCVTLASTIPA